MNSTWTPSPNDMEEDLFYIARLGTSIRACDKSNRPILVQEKFVDEPSTSTSATSRSRTRGPWWGYGWTTTTGCSGARRSAPKPGSTPRRRTWR